VRMLSLPEPAMLEELITQHAEIVHGALTGEHGSAEAVLVRHLRLVLDHLEAFEERYPDYFVPEDEPARRPRPTRRRPSA